MALAIGQFIKNGASYTPQGRVAKSAFTIGKFASIYATAIATAVMLKMMSLGAAAATGAKIGATVGGTAGAAYGGFLGFQVGVALAPFTLGLSIPIATAMGIVIGGSVGVAVGAVAGGLIGLGLASGSTTAVSMGTGAAIGGVVGAVAGAIAGAAAVAWIPVIGPVLAPIGAMIGATIGAAVGATIGAAVGYAVGKYVLDPTKNFISDRTVDIRNAYEAGTSGVSSSVANLFSSAGSFMGGLGSGIFGTIASIGGTVIGGAAGLFGAAFNAITGGGAATAATGTLSLVSTGAGLVSISGGLGLAAIFTAGTLFTPELDTLETILSPPESTNELFTVTKRASQSTIDNSGGNITFTIEIQANKNLTNLSINDTLTRKTGTSSPSLTCNPVPPPTPPIVLAAGTSCTPTFPITVNTSDSDSVINNTVTINATSEDTMTADGSASATVRVGNPPTTDPSGWPTCGEIRQGPWMGPTHDDPRFRSSIDIHEAEGTNIYATHQGTVIAAGPDSTHAIYVAVRGTNYISFYVHLQDIASGIGVGTEVNAGTRVGYMDTTGDIAATSHLHYMIRDSDNIEISAAEFNGLVPGYSLYDVVTSSYGPC